MILTISEAPNRENESQISLLFDLKGESTGNFSSLALMSIAVTYELY
jgi:hypothetical protein